VLTPADRVPPPRPEPAPGSLEARIGELEAMLRARAEAFEPDEGDAFDASPAPAVAAAGARPVLADPVRAATPLADAAAPPPAPGPDVPTPDQDLAGWDDAPDAAPPSRRPAAPEATAEAAPEAAAAEPHRAPPAEAWIDADGDMHADQRGPARDPGLFGDSVDAPEVIDEEMLRDMVRDILRDELQGTLGERITRNVRKLVRAEIARALASRALD
jgi:hypothetical protein